MVPLHLPVLISEKDVGRAVLFCWVRSASEPGVSTVCHKHSSIFT